MDFCSGKSRKGPSSSKLSPAPISSGLPSSDKELLPDLTMSDNVHPIDKTERKYKKKKHRKENQRHFSDLWVRIQERWVGEG